jgi:hypothetical protein
MTGVDLFLATGGLARTAHVAESRGRGGGLAGYLLDRRGG